ncbi:hypothetical protein XspCFBP7912_16800 [Xanthomonas sp. CFBP 7912]|nr:hypothetical protein XspCFBP7912_16800 [Xanthomonas sp. CFBP 7912]
MEQSDQGARTVRLAVTWLSSRLVEGAAPSPLAGHAVNPSMGLDGGIHAANGPAIGKDTAPDSWSVVA